MLADYLHHVYVRLSVTSWCSTKTAKPRITQTTPYDSPGTLVCWRQRSRGETLTGSPPMGAPNRGGVCQNWPNHVFGIGWSYRCVHECALMFLVPCVIKLAIRSAFECTWTYRIVSYCIVAAPSSWTRTSHGSQSSYGRRVDVCSGRLCLTSLRRLMELTVLRREDVGVSRRRDECMTSWRRLEDVKFFGRQHSQECKDPCRRCFCDSWPWPLTFWPQNKFISRTHSDTFVRQVCRSWLHQFF